MALIQRFEDLLCWQKARQLTNLIYDLTDGSTFARDFQLRNQIRDAAGSAMHNAYDLASETKRLINGMITHLKQKRSGEAVR